MIYIYFINICTYTFSKICFTEGISTNLPRYLHKAKVFRTEGSNAFPVLIKCKTISLFRWFPSTLFFFCFFFLEKESNGDGRMKCQFIVLGKLYVFIYSWVYGICTRIFCVQVMLLCTHSIYTCIYVPKKCGVDKWTDTHPRSSCCAALPCSQSYVIGGPNSSLTIYTCTSQPWYFFSTPGVMWSASWRRGASAPGLRRDAVFLPLILQIFGMGHLGDLQDLPGDQNTVGFDIPVHQSGAVIVVVLRGSSRRLEVDSLRKHRGRVPTVEQPAESFRPGSGYIPIGIRVTAPSSGILSPSIPPHANQRPQGRKTCSDHAETGSQARPRVGRTGAPCVELAFGKSSVVMCSKNVVPDRADLDLQLMSLMSIWRILTRQKTLVIHTLCRGNVNGC